MEVADGIGKIVKWTQRATSVPKKKKKAGGWILTWSLLAFSAVSRLRCGKLAASGERRGAEETLGRKRNWFSRYGWLPTWSRKGRGAHV